MLNLFKEIAFAASRVAFGEHLLGALDGWQREILGDEESKRVLMVCSRQAGKSSIAAVAALHRALYHPGSLVLCLAPSLRQSQELMSKILGYYRDLDRPVEAIIEGRLNLELVNGSRIVCLPGTEKTVRGFSGVDLLLLDEAARVDDELYLSVRPMLAVSGGTLMMMSSPFGQRGIFYEAYVSGEDWRRHHVPASQCPRIEKAFLAEERAALGEWWYASEYEAKFEDVPDTLFPAELLQRMVTDEVEPLNLGGGPMVALEGTDLSPAVRKPGEALRLGGSFSLEYR